MYWKILRINKNKINFQNFKEMYIIIIERKYKKKKYKT